MRAGTAAEHGSRHPRRDAQSVGRGGRLRQGRPPDPGCRRRAARRGKTTLADELAAALRAQGRDVIRATIEGLLFPRARRYRRGEYSPEGCYLDTHDYGSLNRVLLDPLGPGGDRRFQEAVYDPSTDTALSPPVTTAPANAVLVFDGVFLLRPELMDRWDLRIFVSTPFEATVARALIRERAALPAAIELP